jgi:hypothetical protein
MIRLREEMHTEKPTMLNCSKGAHIFQVFSFNIWANSVRHCEELIREDWKKLMGNLPIEDIPPDSAESYSEDVWGLDSEKIDNA